MTNMKTKSEWKKRNPKAWFPRIPIRDAKGKYRGTWGLNDLMGGLVLFASIAAIATAALVGHINAAYAAAPHIIDNIPMVQEPAPYDPYAPWDKQPTLQGKIAVAAQLTGENPAKVLKVAFCESSDDPSHVHQNTDGTNDVGVFQLNSIHNIPDTCRLNENCNIAQAMSLMAAQGYKPWDSSSGCWSK